MGEDIKSSELGNVVRIDDERIRDHLGKVVSGRVEETLNALLDAEADRLVGAERPRRRGDLEDAAAAPSGFRDRDHRALSPAGVLGRGSFGRDVLAGVSVRRVEDITQALWGTRVSPGTISNLNKKIYAKIGAWRHRPIEGEHPYVYLDGIVLKRTWAGEIRNVSLLVAIGISQDGYREILGIVEGRKEDKSGWRAFLKHLKERGLKGVKLVISDACLGLVESVAEFYPEARRQRCVVHFYRNVFSHVPARKVREMAHMLKATHAQDTTRRPGPSRRDRSQAGRNEAVPGGRVARGPCRRNAGLLPLSRPALNQTEDE